jgi:hypothetical protein
LSGLFMMLLGVGALLCMRDYCSVEREVEPKLFRFNFPGLARRFPNLPDAYGIAAARAAVVMGLVVGVGAIVGGAIIAF